MAGEPERAGGSADAALPGRPPLCLARNCLTVRQFGPLESIDPNDAMILPHGANLDWMIFGKDRWSAASIRSRRRLRARHGSGHLAMDIITTARRYMATRRHARLRWRHSQRAGGGSEIWPNRRRTRPDSRQ